MTRRPSSFVTLGCALVVGISIAATTATAARETTALTLASGRVSISGTSNIHPYTASTTNVRMVRAQLANGVAAGGWSDVLKPGALEAFEIAIPAATLSSPKEGIDKTMHKALKAEEHPDITFRLARLEAGAAPGALRGVGTLEIAGVARETALELKTQESGSTLAVKGELQLLMTDYGITPPKAMLGMLKTDPRVTITFETVLALPQAPASTN
jgi:hypothetical protein